MSLCTQVVMRMPAGGGRVYAALCARPGTRFDNIGGGHVVRCKEHAPANRTTGDWMRCALHWVIVGGESGPGARPMHPGWARSIRDQCVAAGVPFFFKQWGAWSPHFPGAPGDLPEYVRSVRVRLVYPTGESDVDVFNRIGDCGTIPGSCYMTRVGKARAGRLLDGREWSEFPGARA